MLVTDVGDVTKISNQDNFQMSPRRNSRLQYEETMLNITSRVSA